VNKSPGLGLSPIREELNQQDLSTEIEDEIRSADMKPARTKQAIPNITKIFCIFISLE
jgi:hypothetical protein